MPSFLFLYLTLGRHTVQGQGGIIHGSLVRDVLGSHRRVIEESSKMFPGMSEYGDVVFCAHANMRRPRNLDGVVWSLVQAVVLAGVN